jgi:predicted CxxxxCH...CXXCH cytochrome family protein
VHLAATRNLFRASAEIDEKRESAMTSSNLSGSENEQHAGVSSRTRVRPEMSSEAGVMKRVARWVAVVGVAVLALAAGRAGAATYQSQLSTGLTVAGATTNWTAGCGVAMSGATARITTMTTAGFACANTTITDNTATVAHVFLTLVASPAYAVATSVTGGTFLARLTNSTASSRSASFQLGYVAGGVFTGFGAPVAQAYTNAVTTYTISLSAQSGTVPAGASLALQVVKVTATADVLTLTLGTTPALSGTLTATEVAPTLTLGNSSTGEAASTLAPGAAKVALDAFTLATSAGTVTPSSLTVAMPVGSAALVGALTLESASTCAGTIYSTITNPATDAPSFTTFSGLSIGTAASNLWVCLTPKTPTAMPVPPGTQVAVTGQITAVAAAGYTIAGTDAVSPARTIDNLSPIPPAGLAGAAGTTQVALTWTTEPPDADFTTGGKVVVLGKIGSAPSDVPVEGVDYVTSGPGVTVGTSFVACFAAPGAKTCTATGLTAGQSYYFAAFARDASLNHSIASLPAGPFVPVAFVGEGDTTPGSSRPVVSILDPIDGAVLTLPAKVQVRGFSPSAGGALSPADTVNLVVNGTSFALGTASRNTKYTPSSATAGVWEYTLASGAYAAGSTVTLRANATNAAGGPVNSRTVTVKIASATARGDGRLLVRDNSSQLCSDCHAGTSGHSSESTTNTYGSWATTCRDCHTPHSTTNLALISKQIKPPELTGPTTPQTVTFWNKSGWAANSYAQPGTGAGNTGICEVCHARTTVYRADGSATNGTHDTGPCGNCHKHGKGLGASCTACHGTDGRASIPGADSRQAAAPPLVPTPTPTGAVTGGGVHLQHVNQKNYKTNPLACAECHPIPNVHQGTVDLAWGAIASTSPAVVFPATGAASAGWAATPTCTNWCHGSGIGAVPGGSVGTWSWTGVGGIYCSSCHGAPPPVNATAGADHPQNIYCSSCHGAGANPPLSDPARQTHIDGIVQKPANGCTACHGVLAGLAGAAVANSDPSAAPGYVGTTTGVDTNGNSVVSVPKVGAHDAHVRPSGSLGAVASIGCATCHGSLPPANDITHANGTIGIGFGAPANIGGTPTPPAFNAGWEAAPSCTNYCHSNAAPLGGSDNRVAASPTWTSPSNMTCQSCHQTATFGGTGLSTRHSKHLATYGYTCGECHEGTVVKGAAANTITTPAKHVNGTHEVQFSTTALSAGIDQSTGSYTSTPTYTCASTYCHSGGVSTTPGAFSATASAAIAWNGASTTTCQTCHGFTAAAAPTMGVATGSLFAGSAAHMNHVANNAAAGGVLGTNNYLCGDCHQNTVAAGTDSPITTAANHVNGVKDVSIAPRGTIATTQLYAGTCNTTYCHSSGQLAYTYASISWNAAAWTNKCTGCHGTLAGNTTGAPDYVNGGPNTTTSNSHAAHATSSATCATCHNGFVTTAGTAISGTSHTNGTINVAFDTTVAGTVTYVAGTATPTSATCTSVKCHGTNSTPAVWGSSMDCSGCHMGGTGTTDAEVDDFTYNNGIIAKLDPEDWTTTGHGRPAASGAYDSGNAAAGFDTAIAVSSDDGCKYCHDKSVPHGAFGTSVNPFRLANVGAGTTLAQKNGVCTVCHGGAGYLGKTATLAIDATHYGTKHGGVNGKGGELCWDCHDPHGDSRYTTNATETPVVAANEPLGYMIDSKLVQTRPTSAAGSTTEWGQTATYAANSPRFNKALGTSNTAYDWGDYAFSTLNGVCQVCHTATVHFVNSTWVTTANGDSTHNTTGGRCTKCHAHEQVPTNAFRASCTGCHGNKGAPRTPVTVNADAMLDYAPPTAADGVTSVTTDSHVGAHLSHVNQTTLRTDPILCSQCHGPSLPVHPGTGLANIAWGALATTGAVTPSYVRGTGCSLTYCHGNFKNGNDNVVFTTPGTPTALTSSSVTNTSLTLTWTAPSGAVLYKIERAPDASGVPGTFVQIGTSGSASYADGGLFDGTVYWYRVRAWNPSGDGAYSGNASQRTTGGMALTEFDMVGEAAATTLPVDGITNVLTATTTLTPTNAAVFTNRNVTTPNFVYADATQRRDGPAAAMTAGTTYNFIDLYSPPLTAATTTVGASAQMSIDMYMRAVGTANGTWTITLYEFTSAGATSAAKGTCTTTYNALVTTFQTVACTINNAQWVAAVGSRLKVRVQIVATAATWGRPALFWGATRAAAAGQTYFTASIGTPVTVPPAPTGTPTLTMGAFTNNTASMGWTAVTGATSYIVERGAGATPVTWTQVGQPTGTTLTDQALTATTTYSYRVRATNAGGSGPNSTPNGTMTTSATPAPGTAWAGSYTAGSTTLTCASCHGNPPAGTHPTSDQCSVCHPGYSDKSAVPQTVDKNLHINGVVDKATDCTVCHSVQVGARRPVIGEFAMTWSHKRSAGGAVTKWDCIVCHMEGDPASGLPRDGVAGGHMDGYVNLRDPDTGLNIQNVTFTGALGGTSAGSFGAGTGDATFTAFSRNLGVAFENDPNFLTMAAIQVNQCLKCHDADGAAAFNATKPLNVMLTAGGVTRSAAIPFGTAISYAAIPANQGGTATVPSGTQTAGGAAGGVIRLDSSFATTNSTYHPVLGRGNNPFVFGTRAAPPFDTGVPGRVSLPAAGSNTNFGYLLSCWDCHALPTDAGTLSKTVTAHGGTATIRGTVFGSGASNPAAPTATLCIKCHAQYDTLSSSNHGAGSAFSGSGDSGMANALKNGCSMCHGGFWIGTAGVVQVRPLRSVDVHGSDSLPADGNVGARKTRWLGTATGTPLTVDLHPYAFIRNTYVIGSHSPKSAVVAGTTVVYSPNCANPTTEAASGCGQMSSYSVGGVY